jgi:hypothetical protein
MGDVQEAAEEHRPGVTAGGGEKRERGGGQPYGEHTGSGARLPRLDPIPFLSS